MRLGTATYIGFRLLYYLISIHSPPLLFCESFPFWSSMLASKQPFKLIEENAHFHVNRKFVEKGFRSSS